MNKQAPNSQSLAIESEPSDPFVSIVITSYNRSDMIGECIKSVLNLNFKNFELIVVDGGSIDGSIDVIKKFCAQDKRVQLHIVPHISLSFKRNRGLELAKSSFVFFIDDDIVVDKKWLSKVDSYIKDDFLLVTGRVLPLNKGYKTAVRTSDLPRLWGKKWTDLLFYWECSAGNNYFLNKRLLEKVGNLDENLGAGTPAGAGADTEFYYRVMKNGYKIYYDPKMLAYHYQLTSFSKYLKKFESYNKGATYMVKYKYRNDIKAWTTFFIRFFYSVIQLFFGIISFRKKKAQRHFYEIKGIIEGLMLPVPSKRTLNKK